MSTSTDARSAVKRRVTDDLLERRYAHLPATDTHALVGAGSADWDAFAAEWDDLAVDGFMADGGTYRLRRFGRFSFDAGTGALQLLPHGPYVQGTDINPLNGGVERHFEPLTDAFSESPVLQGLLRGLGEVHSGVEGASRWTINLHPYRILASPDAAGQPAPEGMHRDGVTYIHTMMIRRESIAGGTSGVHADDGTELHRLTLADRGELLLGDDRATMHSVTPVTPAGADRGHRDVLVVAFSVEEPAG